ncbi:MAG: dehydratase [Acidobacteriota bacterium]|nr:dehydratase [Acidobacteriota bacterium]
MMESRYFEEYEIGSVRESLGRTLTETDIVLHAGQSGDFYPHHMDAEWCKQQEFKERIAHGTLVFAIAIGLTAGVVNPEAFTYGYDRLRFINPALIGDTLRVRVTLKEKRDSPKRPGYGVVVELVEAFNQRRETVFACEHLLMVKRRPKTAGSGDEPLSRTPAQ